MFDKQILPIFFRIKGEGRKRVLRALIGSIPINVATDEMLVSITSASFGVEELIQITKRIGAPRGL